jgi:CRP/FNR family transcriptional regulator
MMNASNAVSAIGMKNDVGNGMNGRATPTVYRPAPLSDVCHFLGIEPLAVQDEEIRCAYLVAMEGSCVHKRGDKLENIYIIASGIAKTVCRREEQDFIGGFFLPGDILGLDSVDAMTYLSTTTALTDLLVLSVPYQVLLSYCRQHAVFDLALVRIFADRIADTTAFMEVMARARAEVKVAYFLRAFALRMGTPERPLAEFDFGISRRDIAVYLGVAYETLSRTLREFSDAGIIAITRNKLTIIDHSFLKGMCVGFAERLDAC